MSRARSHPYRSGVDRSTTDRPAALEAGVYAGHNELGAAIADITRIDVAAHRDHWIVAAARLAAAVLILSVVYDMLARISTLPILLDVPFALPLAIASGLFYRWYKQRALVRGRTAASSALLQSLAPFVHGRLELHIDVQRIDMSRKRVPYDSKLDDRDQKFVDSWLRLGFHMVDGTRVALSRTETMTIVTRNRIKRDAPPGASRVRTSKTMTVVCEDKLTLHYDTRRSPRLTNAGVSIWRSLSLPDDARWGDIDHQPGVLNVTMVREPAATYFVPLTTAGTSGLESLLQETHDHLGD